MKANEFVKKFGWEKAKKIVGGFNYNSSNKFITSLKDNSAIHIDDLKRLVESHELMESKGGLDAAKNIVKSQHNLYTDMRLVQAIADVESCL